LFTIHDGGQFVLKIASPSEPPATIDFHARALVHLEQRAPGLPLARMRPSVDGRLVPAVDLDGKPHCVRLVTYLPGVTFDDDQVISPTGLRAIGTLVGALSAALSDFDHPAAGGFMAWDIANGLILDADLWSGLGRDARSLLAPARQRLSAALDVMQRLPRQIIHNDAHAGNLLRSDSTSDLVTGVIDFGDLVHTVTVADLGVSGANLVPHQADPIAALAALAAGFHAHRPLIDAEISALPELVLCRLALSTLLVEHQISNAPHIAEAVAAERPGLLANLARWLALDPLEVADRIEEAL
jgi:Ser/Thr protein kinase RdoA (MazF antagonist)